MRTVHFNHVNPFACPSKSSRSMFTFAKFPSFIYSLFITWQGNFYFPYNHRCVRFFLVPGSLTRNHILVESCFFMPRFHELSIAPQWGMGLYELLSHARMLINLIVCMCNGDNYSFHEFVSTVVLSRLIDAIFSDTFTQLVLWIFPSCFLWCHLNLWWCKAIWIPHLWLDIKESLICTLNTVISIFTAQRNFSDEFLMFH